MGLGFAHIGCVAINQDVANVGALRDGAEFKARRQFGRQVLETVHGEIRAVFQQRDFEFLGKQPLGQGFAFLGE